MKKITIIIPVYNVKNKLNRCLDSIVNQTYKNFEAIVLDDGSTDGSSKICDEYISDKRFVVIHKKNTGVSDTRNKGIEIATGEIIMFLDSDDWYEEDTLKTVINNFEDNIDVLMFGMKVYYKKKERFETTEKEKNYEDKEIISALCTDEINCYLCNKAFKSEILKSTKIETNRRYEDILLMHYLMDKCRKLKYIPQNLYNYWRAENSSATTTCTPKMLDDYIYAINDRIKFLKSKFPEIYEEKKEIQEYFIINKKYAYVLECILGTNEKDENIFSEARKEVIKNKKLLFKYRKDKKKSLLYYYIIKINSKILNSLIIKIRQKV